MIAHQRRQQMLTNNMANVQTSGYKEDRSSVRTFPKMLIDRIENNKGPKTMTQVQTRIGEMGTGVYMQEATPNFKSIDLQADGSLFVTRLDGTIVNAGALNVVEVTRPQVLRSVGDQNFALPNVLGLQQGAIIVPINIAEAKIQQNVLEQSNVDMTKEISELMQTQRSYQFNARAATMADQMSGLINQLRS